METHQAGGFTFKQDSDNVSPYFYLIYRYNTLVAKADTEDQNIRFYDKDASFTMDELRGIVTIVRGLKPGLKELTN